MSAPSNAIPLSEENPEWKEKYAKVHCTGCGWKGQLHELLGAPGNDNTTWCPQCRTSGWVFT